MQADARWSDGFDKKCEKRRKKPKNGKKTQKLKREVNGFFSQKYACGQGKDHETGIHNAGLKKGEETCLSNSKKWGDNIVPESPFLKYWLMYNFEFSKCTKREGILLEKS